MWWSLCNPDFFSTIIASCYYHLKHMTVTHTALIYTGHNISSHFISQTSFGIFESTFLAAQINCTLRTVKNSKSNRKHPLVHFLSLFLESDSTVSRSRASQRTTEEWNVYEVRRTNFEFRKVPQITRTWLGQTRG